jgi:Kef-type K+ transport system membrane component KefB
MSWTFGISGLPARRRAWGVVGSKSALLRVKATAHHSWTGPARAGAGVPGAVLAVFVWLAQQLGLEAILGAFLAGALLRVVDQDAAMTHPRFRAKLEALGFGMFVPIFFVVSGVQFDLAALTANASAITMVPLFLVGLVLVRGLPTLLYRHRVGTHRTLVAALLQATSLPFIVAAAQIGVELGKLSPAAGAALVATGLLSVVLFPLSALSLLRAGEDRSEEPTPAKEAPTTSST